MKPELLASVLAALIAAFAFGTVRESRRVASRHAHSARGATPKAACPRGTLPDQGVCIPVPEVPRTALRSLDDSRIPRLPERDPDYARYVLPVANATVEDTPVPTDGGRGRAGVTLETPRGAAVFPLVLSSQAGPTRLVYAGQLLGNTVVTDHVVVSGARRREFIVIVARLMHSTPAAPRTELTPGVPLGDSSGSLYFETRLVRPNTDVFSLFPKALLDDARTISVDPRNVLAEQSADASSPRHRASPRDSSHGTSL